jgi:4-alpha-glucanotransferase
VAAAASCKRSSGILLHISSLPSAFGIGDLGPESYRFAELLAGQRQHYWSILPLTPTRVSDGNSPYQTSSAFAGNPLLVSPELLAEDGFLQKQDIKTVQEQASRVDFQTVTEQKTALLKQAYTEFKKTAMQQSDFDVFFSQNRHWLDDYTLYAAIRQKTGKPWYEWLPSIRRREPKALAQKQRQLAEAIEQEKFNQYQFFSQWSRLKDHCSSLGVQIVGDMPFYVAHDSADIWVHPELFSLHSNGKSRTVGGVPPDYFSATGQLWGNPTYNWPKHQETGFEWWIARIRHNLLLCDLLRLDHFRGFVAYWQVAAVAKTAMRGKWVKTPSASFFTALKHAFPSLPLIAEDLGYINQPVKDALQKLKIPGMRVILFGLDGSKNNPHTPSNHIENSVVYTGTHDTNTAQGWFTNEASAKEKANLNILIGKKVEASEVSFEVVKLALSSISDLCLIPIQDVLGLGAEARMNNPSKPLGNWTWRVTKQQLASRKLSELGELTANYLRC